MAIPLKPFSARTGVRRYWIRVKHYHGRMLPLLSASLSRDPVADVVCATHQLDASGFAAGEKIDVALPGQSQILKVKNDLLALCFRPYQVFQFRYGFVVHSSA